jgi:transcriptional regulator with XRE-family HTH domain
MSVFGEQLRLVRERHGLRQSDLVALFHDTFARSTIANVESGREAPSPRLWTALREAFPAEAESLEESYLAARRNVGSSRSGTHPASRSGSESAASGTFVVERRDIALVFREAQVPEEILEVYHLQARQDGASSLVCKMWATQHEGFRLSPEVLWGGHIVEAEHVDRDGHTFVLREVTFGRTLRRGDRHAFALRSWVERAPSPPETGIDVSPKHPTLVLGVHLAFLDRQPSSVWTYGPVADEALSPSSAGAPGARPAATFGVGHYTAEFDSPQVGESYGVDWSWS